MVQLQPALLSNNRGFTLLEAMIAFLILTVSMLLTMEGLITANRNVAQNKIRLEAMKLGQELLNDARNQSYVSLAVTSPATTHFQSQRQIASYDISYDIYRTVAVEVSGVSKSITYRITWNNGKHTYTTNTLISDI